VLMMTVMMTYVLRSQKFKGYIQYFKVTLIDWDRLLKILRIGAPVAMQYVFEIGAFAGASLLAGTISATAQASHQVAIQLAAMTYMMASGIAAAATIKVGNSYGNRNLFRLERFAITSYQLVLIFMLITASLFALLNNFLPYIFTSDHAVVIIASQLLIIAGLFQLFDGTQVVGLGVLRGMGDVNIPTIITFVAYWIIGLPSGYLMGIVFNWGIQGIWYGLTLGLLTSSLLLYLRFQRVIKKKKMQFEQSLLK